MKSLVGANTETFDAAIRKELKIMGVPAVLALRNPSMLPYTIVGILGVWRLTRSWNGWMAIAPCGKGISEDDANGLHEEWGSVIRVAGFPVGTKVVAGLSKENTVDSYGIDTEEGLYAFAKFVRQHLSENIKYAHTEKIAA